MCVEAQRNLEHRLEFIHSTTIRPTTTGEACASRHHVDPIEDPLLTPRTSWNYDTEGFKSAPHHTFIST